MAAKPTSRRSGGPEGIVADEEKDVVVALVADLEP